MAKRRRERLGLKQEDLRLYGGPKVSTVGKFERATQDHFPLRTQHQLENALGWPLGSIEDILRSVADGHWADEASDFEERLVHDDPPDLSAPRDPEVQVRRAAELSDDELLAELTFRMKAYAASAEPDEPATGAQFLRTAFGRQNPHLDPVLARMDQKDLADAERAAASAVYEDEVQQAARPGPSTTRSLRRQQDEDAIAPDAPGAEAGA